MIVGLAARSRVVSAGFGSYGAAMSIYYHFLARGRDVVYPKDMAMVIGLGTRNEPATQNKEKQPVATRTPSSCDADYWHRAATGVAKRR